MKLDLDIPELLLLNRGKPSRLDIFEDNQKRDDELRSALLLLQKLPEGKLLMLHCLISEIGNPPRQVHFLLFDVAELTADRIHLVSLTLQKFLEDII